ncbi:MAG TPA: hypothetical protein VM818_01970 [Vicinamibacterales bacterium]|nr:hypothetical protein [Vicinamibacterales bacterium]
MPARQGGTVNEAADDIAISLIRGGSFYWVQEKFRLIRPGAWDLQRRLPFAVAITWLPLLVLAFTYGGLEHLRAVLVDYRVYARVFVGHAMFLGLVTVALWKWAIWVYVLHQISRLNLQLDATNGDRTGGLGFLGDVPRAFSPLVLAISAVIGGTWRAQVLAGQQTLDFLKWPAAFLVVLVLLIFLLPLGLFTPMLVREKREGNLKYGSLRHLHSLQFRRKWLGNRSEHVGELLGNPDVSSLADLSAAFENVDDMIAYPFRRSAVLALLAALALPMLPVVITQIPFKDLIRNLFSAMH